MTVRKYTTPLAFKSALEERLRSSGSGGRELNRRRQLLVFDRLLARIVATFGEVVTLKGGLALELRVDGARSTRDIDLRALGDPGQARERLQAAGRLSLGDFMSFEVSPDADHPQILDAKYEGLRFRSECRLAGKVYGEPFGVDIAYGEPMFGEPDVHVTADILAFAGITPPTVRIFPVETHVAEKLHAYTLPRPHVNSRVKDLPDIALLASVKPLDATRLRAAIHQTFRFRETHGQPAALPAPPPNWERDYPRMARDNQLRWPTLAQVTAAARTFLDPALSGPLDAVWRPDTWTWTLT